VPGYGHFYWDERTARTRRRSYPAFRGDTTADAVVIGGGLTGCTAAYVLAHAGMDVILLEAERLASGATGGGIGAIVPQPDAAFLPTAQAMGRRAARTAWASARRSAADFATTLKRLRIACDLAPLPFLVNAADPADAARLRREQAARKQAGLDAPWLSATAAASALGTESAGALRGGGAFTFDPVRAALGLARAAASEGALVFERSPVRRTRFTRKHANVVLARGTIRTRAIVVATGAPGKLFGSLERHVRRRDGYVVVTEPLSPVMRRETGRRASLVTEVGDAAHWLRWLPDHRAMFAGALSPPAPPRQADKAVVARTAQLMYELSLRYPVISGLPARWGWRLPVVAAPDGLPWIGTHRNFPFHFFALGFGWQGDGLAWFAAKAALRQFTDEPAREDDVFGFSRM
jgi:glycine/D-amino acid oxidase-like deaminating enzyme